MPPSSSPAPRVSVLVCTHNRARDLAACLDALARLGERPGGWEVVVVDNASTDDTAAVARGSALGPRLRLAFERVLGLSAARNTAVREARGELLLFLDDDALPASGWLDALAEALERPGVLGAGGPVEPSFDAPLPPWLSERYLPYLSAWDLGSEIVPLRYNEYPRGANMAFRREAFERLGLFSQHLGRKGRRLLSCEETELFLRLERGGGEILYTPEARVRHQVAASRIDRAWMAARFAAQGRSEAILEWQHAGLAGLRVGLRRSRDYARAATDAARAQNEGEEARLFASLQRRSARGYLLGTLEAVATVPRYRAKKGIELAAWLPFG